MGTLGEIVDACGKLAPSFVEHLYPIVVAGVKDEDDEVCSNSVYTLGVLALTGGDSMVPYPCSISKPPIIAPLPYISIKLNTINPAM